jgi:hypothetical protein
VVGLNARVALKIHSKSVAVAMKNYM